MRVANRDSLRTALACAALLGTWVAVAPPPARAEAFEQAGRVPAARYLSPAQSSGEEWRVAPEADNDGAFNTYVVESRFGSFRARGAASVALRGREIAALLELESVSKSEVFLDAVKDSALGSVETVMAFVASPVETVKGLPSAVGRLFRRTGFQLKEAYVDLREAKEEHEQKQAARAESEAAAAADPEAAAALAAEQRAASEEREEKLKELAKKEALDYLRITGAERRWYAALGVDPSTDNEVLRRAIRSYARVEGLTRFGMKFVGIPAIPGAREIRKTMQLVWETDPWELRLRNRQQLLVAGLSEETARAFEDNPYLTLTQQTGLLAALDEMRAVAGRERLIARGIDLASKEEGQQLFQSTILLARHHLATRPLAEILAGTELPVARTADGRLVAALAADALFWTEEVARGMAEFAATYRGEPATVRELWIVGIASERFGEGAKKLGWTVFDEWQVVTADDEEGDEESAAAAGG